MHKLTREHLVNLLLVLAIAAAAVIASIVDEIYYINLTSRITIVAMAAVGLNLALGYGGMISLGHAAFFGIGGYVAGIAAFHSFDETLFAGFIPLSDQMVLIWIGAMLVTVLVALGIGVISLRTKGAYFIMITLAFACLLYTSPSPRDS